MLGAICKIKRKYTDIMLDASIIEDAHHRNIHEKTGTDMVEEKLDKVEKKLEQKLEKRIGQMERKFEILAEIMKNRI